MVFELTHISFIFESIFAATTMKVSSALSIKDAMLHGTFFGSSVSLKSVVIDSYQLVINIIICVN